jgi:hypothetical protein
MGVGRWSCMDIEFLINFGFMVVKSGCFKNNKKNSIYLK